MTVRDKNNLNHYYYFKIEKIQIFQNDHIFLLRFINGHINLFLIIVSFDHNNRKLTLNKLVV